MRCMRCVHNDLFFLGTRCGRGIPNIGSETAVCRYGKPESEWKRARDTDLVRCAQEWARSEGTRHVDRYCDPSEAVTAPRLLDSFPPTAPIPGIVPFFEALSSSLGITSPGRGPSNHARSSRNVHFLLQGCFRSTPVNCAAKVGGSSLHCFVRDLACCASSQTTASNYLPYRFVMRLTRSSNR